MTQSEPTVCQPTQSIAGYIDHTWLPVKSAMPSKPVVTETLTRLVAEATEHHFAAVCVRPEHAAETRQLLGADSAVKLAVVVGFPDEKVVLLDEEWSPTIGNVSMDKRLTEIKLAKEATADELDVVLDVFAFQTAFGLGKVAGFLPWLVEHHTAAHGINIKLILETDLLTPDQIDAATFFSAKAGLAMVKTSTGYVADGQGATVEAIQRMHTELASYHQKHPEQKMLGIKASGGVRTPEQAAAMIATGATRIGTSNGVALLGHDDGQAIMGD